MTEKTTKRARSTKGFTRACVYARVSTDQQTVDMQLEELRLVAKQRGWQIVEEFVDEGISGAKDSRPALDRMMAAARAGKIDIVAVWRFDRFARSTRHLLEALEEFRLLGVDFVSVREQIDTSTPLGVAVFTIVAAVAELERSLIRERSLAGIRRAQAAGVHCGRRPVDMDVRPAVALLEQHRTLSDVARILDVDRTTLRRRLTAAGQWPREGVVKRGVAGEGPETVQ